MPRQRVNIREIAKLANVSVAAVSYAMHGDPRSKLSESKRKEIQAICARLRYHPNENARRVFRKKSETIAFFFPPLVGNVYRTFVDQNFSYSLIGAQNELVRHGMDLLLVETPCYTARLRLADGMLEQVERQGKPLCGTTAWSTDRTTAIQLATNSLRKGNSVSCTAGKLCWTWRFSPQGIRLELDSTRLKAPELSLIVPVPEASRYQARCAEGYLDDCFTAWPRTGTDNPENDLFNILSYRLPGGNILCDFELFPLHPAKPRIAVQNSAGITEFLFRDLLKQTPANIRLLDRFNATPGWALQIALREKRCPLLEPLPVFPAGKIKLDLNFSTGNLQASPEQRHPLSLFNGKIKLDHNGMDWEITGPFGKVLLRRNNGLIRSWYGSDNKLLFRRELLGTTRFHSRRALASASAAYDTEGGTHLAIRDGKLLLAFSGMLMRVYKPAGDFR